jgi:hypothetical protein
LVSHVKRITQIEGRIFGPKRNEVTGGWKKFHNEELHNLYSSPNIIRMNKSRRMRWMAHVARMEAMRNTCEMLVGKLGGKRSLGRHRVWWEDDIKMYLMEIDLEGVDWIHLTQDRDRQWTLLNTVMNLRVP